MKMSAYEAILLSVGSVIAFGFLPVILYRLIRPLFNVTVTCWFCHQKSVVPYENRNCWDCLLCDQYNGFQDDGGYNKAIPAQHVEELNHPVTAGDRKDGYWKAENGLCETCNRNQQLKICQLANFVPYHEANFDAEVAVYAKDLENVYQLCSRCTAHVDATLKQQDAILSPRLLDDRLRKTASEHSYSSSSRSCSSSASQRSRVVQYRPQPPQALPALLASALDCLSAVCAALIAVGRIAYPLPGPVAAGVTGLVGLLPSWCHSTLPLVVPFTHDEQMTLLTFTGFCAKATALLVMRGFLWPLYANVVATAAWCLLLGDALCPPSSMDGDVAKACRTVCALAAVATTVRSLRGRLPQNPGAVNRTKVRRAGRGRACPSLSRSDSPTSDCRTCYDGHAGSVRGHAGRSVVGSGGGGSSIASAGSPRSRSGSVASLPQQSFDVHSSLGSLCLGAATASSTARHHSGHLPRTWSTASIYSSQSTGQAHLRPNAAELHTKALAQEPLIRPGRLSPAPHLEHSFHMASPPTGGLAPTAAGLSFQDLRNFCGSLPTTEKGVPPSLRSGLSRSRTSPLTWTRPYSEDGSASYLCSSYHTAGIPRSVADMIARHAASASGQQSTTAKNGSFAGSHTDKPLFAKVVIGISVGLNVTALVLLAHQYVN